MSLIINILTNVLEQAQMELWDFWPANIEICVLSIID